MGVPAGPSSKSLETETFRRAAKFAQALRKKAVNAKRPAADLSGPGVNWCVGLVRGKTKSSPRGTLFGTILSASVAGNYWPCKRLRSLRPFRQFAL